MMQQKPTSATRPLPVGPKRTARPLPAGPKNAQSKKPVKQQAKRPHVTRPNKPTQGARVDTSTRHENTIEWVKKTVIATLNDSVVNHFEQLEQSKQDQIDDNSSVTHLASKTNQNELIDSLKQKMAFTMSAIQQGLQQQDWSSLIRPCLDLARCEHNMVQLDPNHQQVISTLLDKIDTLQLQAMLLTMSEAALCKWLADRPLVNESKETIVLTDQHRAQLVQAGYSDHEVSLMKSQRIPFFMAQKLLDKDTELTFDQSVQCISRCVELGQEQAVKAQSKDIVLIVGNSGCGKSTAVNYLHGCEMESVQSGFSHQVRVAANSTKPEVSAIGHGEKSKTFIPALTTLDNNMICVDAPGFFDNRGTELNIANAVNLKNVLYSARGVRVAMLISFNSLDQRGRGIQEMVDILRSLFGDSLPLDALAKHVLIGITRVPMQLDSQAVSHKRVVDVVMGYNLLPNSFQDSIMILDPLERRVDEQNGRHDWSKRLMQLSPVQQPKKLFNTVLSDQDELMLLKASRQVAKDVAKSLSENNPVKAARTLHQLHHLQLIDHPEIRAAYQENIQHCNLLIERQGAVVLEHVAIKPFDTSTVSRELIEFLRVVQVMLAFNNGYQRVAIDCINSLQTAYQNYLGVQANKQLDLLEKNFSQFDFSNETVIFRCVAQLKQHNVSSINQLSATQVVKQCATLIASAGDVSQTELSLVLLEQHCTKIGKPAPFKQVTARCRQIAAQLLTISQEQYTAITKRYLSQQHTQWATGLLALEQAVQADDSHIQMLQDVFQRHSTITTCDQLSALMTDVKLIGDFSDVATPIVELACKLQAWNQALPQHVNIDEWFTEVTSSLASTRDVLKCKHQAIVDAQCVKELSETLGEYYSQSIGDMPNKPGNLQALVEQKVQALTPTQRKLFDFDLQMAEILAALLQKFEDSVVKLTHESSILNTLASCDRPASWVDQRAIWEVCEQDKSISHIASQVICIMDMFEVLSQVNLGDYHTQLDACANKIIALKVLCRHMLLNSSSSQTTTTSLEIVKTLRPALSNYRVMFGDSSDSPLKGDALCNKINADFQQLEKDSRRLNKPFHFSMLMDNLRQTLFAMTRLKKKLHSNVDWQSLHNLLDKSRATYGEQSSAYLRFLTSRLLPNKWSKATTLSFTLPKSSNATLKKRKQENKQLSEQFFDSPSSGMRNVSALLIDLSLSKSAITQNKIELPQKQFRIMYTRELEYVLLNSIKQLFHNIRWQDQSIHSFLYNQIITSGVLFETTMVKNIYSTDRLSNNYLHHIGSPDNDDDKSEAQESIANLIRMQKFFNEILNHVNSNDNVNLKQCQSLLALIVILTKEKNVDPTIFVSFIYSQLAYSCEYFSHRAFSESPNQSDMHHPTRVQEGLDCLVENIKHYRPGYNSGYGNAMMMIIQLEDEIIALQSRSPQLVNGSCNVTKLVALIQSEQNKFTKLLTSAPIVHESVMRCFNERIDRSLLHDGRRQFDNINSVVSVFEELVPYHLFKPDEDDAYQVNYLIIELGLLTKIVALLSQYQLMDQVQVEQQVLRPFSAFVHHIATIVPVDSDDSSDMVEVHRSSNRSDPYESLNPETSLAIIMSYIEQAEQKISSGESFGAMVRELKLLYEIRPECVSQIEWQSFPIHNPSAPDALMTLINEIHEALGAQLSHLCGFDEVHRQAQAEIKAVMLTDVVRLTERRFHFSLLKSCDIATSHVKFASDQLGALDRFALVNGNRHLSSIHNMEASDFRLYYLSHIESDLLSLLDSRLREIRTANSPSLTLFSESFRGFIEGINHLHSHYQRDIFHDRLGPYGRVEYTAFDDLTTHAANEERVNVRKDVSGFFSILAGMSVDDLVNTSQAWKDLFTLFELFYYLIDVKFIDPKPFFNVVYCQLLDIMDNKRFEVGPYAKSSHPSKDLIEFANSVKGKTYFTYRMYQKCNEYFYRINKQQELGISISISDKALASLQTMTQHTIALIEEQVNKSPEHKSACLAGMMAFNKHIGYGKNKIKISDFDQMMQLVDHLEAHLCIQENKKIWRDCSLWIDKLKIAVHCYQQLSRAKLIPKNYVKAMAGVYSINLTKALPSINLGSSNSKARFWGRKKHVGTQGRENQSQRGGPKPN